MLVGICLIAFGNIQVGAEERYPVRPIDLIVPWGAGGTTDLAARAIANVIPKYIGQSVMVINKTGGGGITGTYEGYKAKPDGYTMLMASIGANIIAPALNPKLAYKYNDFTMIAITQANPMILVVRSNSPWKTVNDLIKYIKENPGKVRYHYSPGGDTFAPELFIKTAGIDRRTVLGVPNESSGPGAISLVQGSVDWALSVAPPYMPFIKEGRLRVLAVSTESRIGQFPNVPTLNELGYGEAALVGWAGIFGPPKIEKYIVDKWEKAIEKAMKEKAYIATLENIGGIEFYKNPKETQDFVEKMFVKFQKTGEELNLVIK